MNACIMYAIMYCWLVELSTPVHNIFMWAERHACRMKILPRELGIPTLLVLHYEFVHVFDLTVTTRDAKTMQIII